MTNNIFISYSRKDEKEKDALLEHLGVLEKTGLIDVWSDDKIAAGVNWKAAIEDAIQRANIAILLVTATFLNSDFILDEEVRRLLQLQESKKLYSLAVIAKPCAWERVPWLGMMKVLPKNGEPVWRDGGIHADEELAIITNRIARIIERPSLKASDPFSRSTDPHKESARTETFRLKCFYCYSFHPDDERIVTWFRDFLAAFSDIEIIEARHKPQPVKTQIEQCIRDSDFICAILTKRKKGVSSTILKEIRQAFDAKKIIVAFVDKAIPFDDLGDLQDITEIKFFQQNTLCDNVPEYVRYIRNAINEVRKELGVDRITLLRDIKYLKEEYDKTCLKYKLAQESLFRQDDQ